MFIQTSIKTLIAVFLIGLSFNYNNHVAVSSIYDDDFLVETINEKDDPSLQLQEEVSGQTRSSTAGKRQPVLGAGPIRTEPVVKEAGIPIVRVLPIAIAGGYELGKMGKQLYDEYQEKKREEMLDSPIPPAPYDGSFAKTTSFGLYVPNSESPKSKHKDIVDWLNNQKKYDPRNVECFTEDPLYDARLYEIYRQNALQSGRTCPLVPPATTVFVDIPSELTGTKSSATTGSKNSKQHKPKASARHRSKASRSLTLFDEAQKRRGESDYERAERLKYGPKTRQDLDIAPFTPKDAPNQTYMTEHHN